MKLSAPVLLSDVLDAPLLTFEIQGNIAFSGKLTVATRILNSTFNDFNASRTTLLQTEQTLHTVKLALDTSIEKYQYHKTQAHTVANYILDHYSSWSESINPSNIVMRWINHFETYQMAYQQFGVTKQLETEQTLLATLRSISPVFSSTDAQSIQQAYVLLDIKIAQATELVEQAKAKFAIYEQQYETNKNNAFFGGWGAAKPEHYDTTQKDLHDKQSALKDLDNTKHQINHSIEIIQACDNLQQHLKETDTLSKSIAILNKQHDEVTIAHVEASSNYTRNKDLYEKAKSELDNIKKEMAGEAETEAHLTEKDALNELTHVEESHVATAPPSTIAPTSVAAIEPVIPIPVVAHVELG